MARWKIRYKRNPHQKEFDEDSTTKFLNLFTGFGGGKSYAIAMKAFKLSKLNRNIPGGIVVPSIADFKKDLLPLMEEILDENKVQYRYHKTDKWFRFPWSSAKAYVATAEKKIRGPNWGWAVINEITLITHDRFKEVTGRVRIKGAKFPQIAGGGTPEGTAHWAHEVFVEEPLANSRNIHGDTRDNQENLSDDYIPTMESSYDAVMLDAYLRGLWVNMTGSRFYYAYDPKSNDDDTIEQIPGAEVHVSLDYNVQPMVATLWNIVTLTNGRGAALVMPGGQTIKRAKAFDQIVIENDADIHTMSRAMYQRNLDPETTTIYPDPAGRNRNSAVEGAKGNNEVLRQQGWTKIRVKSAAPRMGARRLAHNNLLSKGWVKLHPKKCKSLKKDYEGVEMDKATFEKIKTNLKLTHASDGADYFLDIIFPLSGVKPPSGSIKYR